MTYAPSRVGEDVALTAVAAEDDVVAAVVVHVAVLHVVDDHRVPSGLSGRGHLCHRRIAEPLAYSWMWRGVGAIALEGDLRQAVAIHVAAGPDEVRAVLAAVAHRRFEDEAALVIAVELECRRRSGS